MTEKKQREQDLDRWREEERHRQRACRARRRETGDWLAHWLSGAGIEGDKIAAIFMVSQTLDLYTAIEINLVVGRVVLIGFSALFANPFWSR